MEDKAKIARSFCNVLQMTWHLRDLKDLTYHKTEDEEVVVAEFQNGRTKTINVHWDTGGAMLHDILRGLQ